MKTKLNQLIQDQTTSIKAFYTSKARVKGVRQQKRLNANIEPTYSKSTLETTNTMHNLTPKEKCYIIVITILATLFLIACIVQIIINH